jgi:hypothetical protein
VTVAVAKISRADQEAAYRQAMGQTAADRQKRAAAVKCKSCHAPIRWATVKGSGKHMPVDFDANEGGNVFLYSKDGTCVVGKQTDRTPFGATRHYSHFATCPHADQHRGPR